MDCTFTIMYMDIGYDVYMVYIIYGIYHINLTYIISILLRCTIIYAIHKVVYLISYVIQQTSYLFEGLLNIISYFFGYNNWILYWIASQALLYLVPGTLGTTCVLGWRRIYIYIYIYLLLLLLLLLFYYIYIHISYYIYI